MTSRSPSILVGFSLLFVGVFSLCFLTFGRAEAGFDMNGLKVCGRDFAAALNAKNGTALQGMVKAGYWTELSKDFNKNDFGTFKYIERTCQFLDTDTSCFYLRCDRKNRSELILVTVVREGQTMKVGFGPLRSK